MARRRRWVMTMVAVAVATVMVVTMLEKVD